MGSLRKGKVRNKINTSTRDSEKTPKQISRLRVNLENSKRLEAPNTGRKADTSKP